MGQSGAWTAEVFFDDVRVPADALIGEEGRGYAKALTVLSRGRLHIAALCVGMAQRVLDESVAYAATAKQGGAPIGRFQLVQAHARRHARRAARRPQHGARRRRPRTTAARTPRSARRRPSCSAPRWSAARSTAPCRCTAAWATCATTPVERFYRDARLFRLYEGTSEVQRRDHRRRAAARGRHGPWLSRRSSAGRSGERRRRVGELGTALRDLVDAAVRTEVPLDELAAGRRGRRELAARLRAETRGAARDRPRRRPRDRRALVQPGLRPGQPGRPADGGHRRPPTAGADGPGDPRQAARGAARAGARRRRRHPARPRARPRRPRRPAAAA